MNKGFLFSTLYVFCSVIHPMDEYLGELGKGNRWNAVLQDLLYDFRQQRSAQERGDLIVRIAQSKIDEYKVLQDYLEFALYESHAEQELLAMVEHPVSSYFLSSNQSSKIGRLSKNIAKVSSLLDSVNRMIESLESVKATYIARSIKHDS